MVVICLPAASATETLQDRIATPSIWTVQAPPCAMPQPYFVPVSPTFSRIAHNSGVSGSTSIVKVLPFIVRFAIADPLIGPIHRLDFAGRVVRENWNGSNQYSALAQKLDARGKKIRSAVLTALELS